MSNPRVTISDDKGVLWSASGPDAKVEGLGLLHAVEQGEKSEYAAALGTTWSGDLVLNEEIARVR